VRIDYNEDGDHMMYLWMGTATRAINGKPGQKILRELKAGLEALPEKRLVYSQVSDGKDVCAVGSLMLHRLMQIGKTREEALAILKKKYTPPPHVEGLGPTELSKDVGMTYTLAWEIMEKNDGNRSYKLTPEERYERVLKWVTEQIKDEAPAAT